ncbi:MAG: MFS transporter, partial [Bdellovibrionales bacterium]|nr:MFS transporter [Bdellovibrionales bacterium]
DGTAYAAMTGLGEGYLAPFAVFLNASSSQVGMLATLPPLLGVSAQGVSLWLMERVSSRRTIVASGAFLQGAVWFLLAAVALSANWESPSIGVLLFLAICNSLAFHSTVPVWSSLIGDVISSMRRGEYFGFRNRRMGFFAFISLVIGGNVLHFARAWSAEALGFAVIFCLAGFARISSARWILRYPDPVYVSDSVGQKELGQSLYQLLRSNYAKFVLFFSSMNFSSAIAGPYFAVYVLNDLRVSYMQFACFVSAEMVCQFLAAKNWGAFTDRIGSRKVMIAGGIGIACVPFLWCLSSNFFFLVGVQCLAGISWSGFQLAATNFLFTAVPPPSRAKYMAYQSLMNALFVFFGSLLGAYLASTELGWFSLERGISTPQTPLIRVFVVSGFLRMFTLMSLVRNFTDAQSR